MRTQTGIHRWTYFALAGATLVGCAVSLPASATFAQGTPQTAAPVRTPPAVGTIKSVSTTTIVLATETATDITVQLGADVKYLRVPPGSKDLKEATAIQLSDLQVGDRILVRGKPAEAAATFLATSIISMKKADIDLKQAQERQEWQRNGIGGLVKSVDAPAGVVTIGTMAATGSKDVQIHLAKATLLRRYAPGSVKFDDAKPSSLAEIRAGDQLRARGTKSEDGANFSAEEIVTGSFRNIAGTVSAVDAGAGTMTVMDLASHKAVEIKMSGDSQLRKLPAPIATRIAMRLKGIPADASAGAPGAGVKSAAVPGGPPPAAGQGTSPGMAAGRAGGGGDLSQMLTRLPASTLGDFQKGDAVMIVATSSALDAKLVVITLLGGVEPILQASPQGQAASILTPWSLSGGGGDAGTP